MTDEEKLAELSAICTDTSMTEDALSVYLGFAGDAILQKCYPFLIDYSTATVPEKYHHLQVQLANEMVLKRGAEGESAHSENGISRTYESDYPLLKKVLPFAKVIGDGDIGTE